MIPIDRIQANPDQPRRSFDEKDLQDLAASIREKGVIQPLILRPHPKDPGGYQIVAGERRWRAAQIASGPRAAGGGSRSRRRRGARDSRSSRTSSAPTSTRSRRRTAIAS